MKSLFEEPGGTYHREGDYLLPDLIAPEAPQNHPSRLVCPLIQERCGTS